MRSLSSGSVPFPVDRSQLQIHRLSLPSLYPACHCTCLAVPTLIAAARVRLVHCAIAVAVVMAVDAACTIAGTVANAVAATVAAVAVAAAMAAVAVADGVPVSVTIADAMATAIQVHAAK
jgi:hypothetical protein